MRRPTDSLVVLCGLALLAAPAVACLWDYDTLRDERRGLPGVAEVLAGRWEKHSRFFYENRVERMKALIAREPNNLAAYDNLAVAHEKLGDQDAAIEVMRRKERVKPGEYTTYANLGTFYLHKGDLDNGITYIRKALEINPAAHFGREEYQLKVAEFYRDAKADPGLLKRSNFLFYRMPSRPGREGLPQSSAGDVTALPTTDPATRPATGPATTPAADDNETFETIVTYRGGPEKVRELGLKDNVFDGLVGIIRFGTGTSAELYLTLGDLLALRGDKNLAYRAYQRAADLNHPRQGYLKAAMYGVREGMSDKSDVAPEKIAAERAAAEAWVAAYQQYEDDLIRAGKDPDDEASYAAFYKAHGRAVEPPGFSPGDVFTRDPARQTRIVVVAVVTIMSMATVLLVVRFRRQRRAYAARLAKYRPAA